MCHWRGVAGGGLFLGGGFFSRLFESRGLGHIGEKPARSWDPSWRGCGDLPARRMRGHDFRLDVGLEPVHYAIQILTGIRDVLRGKELFELIEDGIVYFKIFVDGAVGEIMLGEIEENIVRVAARPGNGPTWAVDFVVGRDAAPSVNGAAGICELDLAILSNLRTDRGCSNSRRAKLRCSCAG